MKKRELDTASPTLDDGSYTADQQDKHRKLEAEEFMEQAGELSVPLGYSPEPMEISNPQQVETEAFLEEAPISPVVTVPIEDTVTTTETLESELYTMLSVELRVFLTVFTGRQPKQHNLLIPRKLRYGSPPCLKGLTLFLALVAIRIDAPSFYVLCTSIPYKPAHGWLSPLPHVPSCWNHCCCQLCCRCCRWADAHTAAGQV